MIFSKASVTSQDELSRSLSNCLKFKLFNVGEARYDWYTVEVKREKQSHTPHSKMAVNKLFLCLHFN